MLTILIPLSTPAQQRLLHLRVWRVDSNGHKQPAQGASVLTLGYGNPTRVQAQGLAQVFLPSQLEPGDPLTVHVSLEGHALFQPTEGRVVVPRNPEGDEVEVVLLPLGSKLFLNDEAIEQLIADAAHRAKEQVRPQGQPSHINLSRYVREWAVRYGFGFEEVRAQVERWGAEVERQRGDGRQLALAAFVRHDFQAAAQYASEAAELKLQRLSQVRRLRKNLGEEAVRNLRLEADAHVRLGDYAQALVAYEEALRYVSREEDARTWAELKLEQGRASLELGVRADETSACGHLENAVSALEQAMGVLGGPAQDSLQRAWRVLRERRTAAPPGLHVISEQLSPASRQWGELP
ncbi:hypothetical protein KYC5002_26740 [Archangium violaceum]|uniref:hypothetical protein n=1 Tax=Archangium violaceum TaxID=83451 RepID=UPI002B3031E9|nr:hypothetical protein KYC5002_26740 [Archangium gephyra]